MASSIMIRVAEHGQQVRSRKGPKLMIVGSDHEAAIEHHYIKYLVESGIDNVMFPAQGKFFEYYNASLVNKILFKLGVSKIYQHINEELLALVTSVKPDILLVFKGMEIFSSTFKTIKEGGTKLVNYNPDNPFLFSGKGSGNQNIYDSIPYFDLHITYDQQIQEKLERLGLKVARIPFGFELNEQDFSKVQNEPEVNRVCFLGNPDKHRVEFLNNLASQGVPIDVYGHNWNRFSVDSKIKTFGPAYALEFWRVLRRYRVQLNLMRPHNPDSHNMRSFEVPAVGGIGLFPDTPDHRAFFKEGEELFLYKGIEDCVSKANALLNLSSGDAQKIRIKARARSLNDGYSYKQRALELYQKMEELL